jgi:hypothetical protein
MKAPNTSPFIVMSAPAMSTNISQVEVAHFPSFKNIYHFTFPGFAFILINLLVLFSQTKSFCIENLGTDVNED